MKKVKRIAAITGIVILVSLYLITLISAIFTTQYSGKLFLACIYATFVVPVMIYAYLLVYKILKKIGHPDKPDEIAQKSNSIPKGK